MKRKRPHQWPLAKVCRECRSAPAVWLALEDMASERGSLLVTPTRKQIAVMSGVNKLATISRALTTLEQAEWIVREHVPVHDGRVQTATLLRITLRRSARKRVHTAQVSVAPEKGCKGSARKRVRDFSLRRRAGSHAALRSPTGGCARAEEDDGPIVKISDLLKQDAASGESGGAR